MNRLNDFQIPFNESKLFVHKKSVFPWKHISNLDRKSEMVITRLRLGHTRITHEYIFKKLPHPMCSFCNRESLNSSHLLFECSKFSSFRKFPDPNCHSIPDNEIFINTIINYLKKTELFSLI